MKLENLIRSELRKKALCRPPRELQGVTKDRIRKVLRSLDRENDDRVDAVFALLDDHTRNWFGAAAVRGLKFRDGASTAHIACHVGLLQRASGKLDREGRDYWLKPLWEIGVLEKNYFDPDKAEFLPGHPIAKSPNSSYRIAPSFLKILKAPDAELPKSLGSWMTDDAIRSRLKVQADLAKAAAAGVENHHKNLITAAIEVYVPRFLPGFEVLNVDAGDGDRITDRDREALNKAGLHVQLDDSVPDILLWNKSANALWVIEAVTSDGEVDWHKVENLTAFARRHQKSGIGFTTAYATWKDAASRQGKHKNIAPGTKIWIEEDGAKQFTVETFQSYRRQQRQ